jgi:hypothetical protein
MYFNTVVEEFSFEDCCLLGCDANSLVDKYLHVRGICSLHIQNTTVNQTQGKLVLTEGRRPELGM